MFYTPNSFIFVLYLYFYKDIWHHCLVHRKSTYKNKSLFFFFTSKISSIITKKKILSKFSSQTSQNPFNFPPKTPEKSFRNFPPKTPQKSFQNSSQKKLLKNLKSFPSKLHKNFAPFTWLWSLLWVSPILGPGAV